MKGQHTPPVPVHSYWKWLVLALVLALAAAATYAFAAFTHAVIRIHGSEHWLVVGGTTAGGATVWVLAKTGIDLLKHATEVSQAIRSPGWEAFRSALRTLVGKHLPAILGIVFSLSFVGQDVKEVIAPSDPPPVNLDEIKTAIDGIGLNEIKTAIAGIDLNAAMTAQGYTTELAADLSDPQPAIQAALRAQGYTSELAQALQQLPPPVALRSVLDAQGYTEQLAASLARLTDRDPTVVHNVVEIAEQDLRDALDAHEYTTPRALLLDNLAERPGRRSRTHFATFPFAFAPGTAEVSDQDDDQPVSPGLAFNPEEHDGMIRTIVSALGSCASQDSPVELLVEGYASSEPYDDHPDSDRLNLQLAHERRDNIVAALHRAIQSAGAAGTFNVHGADYKDLDDMKRYRGFNDRPADAKGEWFPQDFLTRAAHVQVVGLGLCAIN